jgi:tetratricopeptide (TPR) repeat protein
MKRNWQTRTLIASVVALTSVQLWAKNNNVATPAPAPSATAAPQAPETLANLGDHRLMNELADRGLDTLLERYFDLHKTPEAEQKAIRSMGALRDLSNPKLSNTEKEKKVKQIVEGIQITLPGIKDPNLLANDAALLLLYGTTRDVNLLEYWGENPATEARLRPTAQAIYDMLGKSSKEAAAQAGLLAAKINPQNQNTVGAEWDRLDQLSHNVEYNQNMMAYDVALAMPKAERAKFVDKPIKYLADQDSADSTVMPRVHVMIGKLNLVAGNYDEAIKYLDAVANSDKTIQPPADPGQVYLAKYFGNVARLEAGKIPEAKKGLEDLIAWEKTGMPSDPDTQKGIAAAAEMLRYRIYLGEAAKTSGESKVAAETNATNVLLKLSQDRPELRGIIYQQLVERLPKDAPVKNMDPLLLRGLMAKGFNEANKPEGSQLDKTALERGLAAAQEVAIRKEGANITPDLKDEAGRGIPVLFEALGKKVDAAQAFLKYAKEHANVRSPYAMGALEDTGRLVFELRKTDNEDPRVSALYDDFLPVAIAFPFNKVNLAFYYAQRLAAQSKPQEAIKYFRMVAKADRNYNAAQFYVLEAMQDLLDTKLAPDARTQVTKDLMAQCEQVRQNYAGSSEAIARKRLAIATLVEAETAGADLKKPEQTLQLLTGFDEAVKGMPEEKLLVNQALLARLNANMALGKLNEAKDSLVMLLNKSGGAQGADFVRGLLDKLDKDLNKAEAVHDTARMAEIAQSEADLSGYLVDWAKNNPNAEIKSSAYRYMVFDARTKRLAGTLSTDPAKREALLAKAMDAYKKLQSPENTTLFKATLDQAKIASGDLDPNQPDPNVRLGIALTDFELKNYKESGEILGDLLNNGKLGPATLATVDTTGEQKVVDNDTYWEATYKLYFSNVAAAKGDETGLAGTKQGLKNLLVRGGIPTKWQDQFEGLRKQIIPEFDVATLLAPTSQPAGGATQPVSAR